MASLQFKGVIPPMITPFSENGDVDYKAFEFNMQKWNSDKIGAYLVLGSNSETTYLSEDEKLKLIEIAVKTAPAGRPVIVGSGSDSLRETIRLTNLAGKMGCSSALVLTPFYYAEQMTSESLIKYFSTVADNCDIPILLYNVPKFTHVNMKGDAVAELAKHPGIIGMKDSTGDVTQLGTFKKLVPDDFNLMVGTASSWFPALTLGVKAGIHALANCNPNECAAVQEAYESGDLKKAAEIYMHLLPLNTAVTATYSIAGLKYACTCQGYQGKTVRSPLLPITPEKTAAIDKIMKKALDAIKSL
ncbi:MAG: dihydrodipicolinate synthase family protein [Treponema sp.]|nr:dihydrodipicolinate synthase family protein [Treponema sp.]